MRGTWAPHGVKWWYLVPSMDHYRCHCIYVTKKEDRGTHTALNFTHKILHYPTILPQKMSSSRRTNWPMPWRAQHTKRHFTTLATPKQSQLSNSQIYSLRLQIICIKEQTLHNSVQWPNHPLYLTKCVQVWPNIFPQNSPISQKMMMWTVLQVFRIISTCPLHC